MIDEDMKKLFMKLVKVVDNLEKRIATLEKVLESHAKCIGEMREDKKTIDWGTIQWYQLHIKRKLDKTKF